MQSSAPQVSRLRLRSVASWTAAPPTAGPASAPRRRPPAGLGVKAVAAVALMSFSVGVAAAHVHEHYVRFSECQRWRENVHRWVQVVADGSGELRPADTMVLALAHGAMLAVRDQVCGY
jgi:hypothetical protein